MWFHIKIHLHLMDIHVSRKHCFCDSHLSYPHTFCYLAFLLLGFKILERHICNQQLNIIMTIFDDEKSHIRSILFVRIVMACL